MLNVLRKKAGSWVVKVLLLLLVASFAIWGIGDIFYGSGTNPAVATVGDSEIGTTELATAFDRSVANLQRQLGGAIDRQQAVQLGVLQQTLQDLIRQRLVDLRAQEMGLTAAEDTLRSLVTDNPVFQTGGQFDRNRFDQLLRASGLSEAGYLASLQQDVVRQTLTSSIAGPAVVPEALADAIYRHRNEQRRGRYLAVATGSVVDLPEPTDDELAAFHEANAPRFTAPAYRTVTLVTLEPADLSQEIEISDELVEAEYQDRINSYRTPEHRTVEQVLATERDAIDAALDRMSEGFTLEAAVAELDELSLDQLGRVAKGDLPAEFEEVAFALDVDQVSEPVESAFGWHLFRVTAIEPEETVPLDEVRDQLRDDLTLAEASDRLPAFGAQLDDEFAAGSTLEDAAAVLDLTPVTVTLDAGGLDEQGEAPEGLPSWPEIIPIVQQTPEGELSLLEETDSGNYFVVRVDSITEPRLKPIDEVRAELVEAWQADQREALAEVRAEGIRTRLADGEAWDEVEVAEGLTTTVIEPLTRNAEGDGANLSRAAIQALFRTDAGAVAADVVPVADGFVVLVTDEVIVAEADADALTELTGQLQQDVQTDLISQFEEQLRRDYPVEIDGLAINQLIDPAASY